jgi:flap endonuclease-1
LNDFRFTEKWYRQAVASGDKPLAKRIALSREYMWQNILNESKHLLGSLGVPYMEAPASAESQCAQLVIDKIAYYSNSQDYDSLLFGCPRMLQNLTKSLSRKIQGRWVYQKITPYEINLKETLSELHIDQFQLVDMGILIGTDYFEGISNIGPKTALKLIKQHKNIESVLHQFKGKYEVSALNQELLKRVRRIFLFPEVRKLSNFTWNYPNEARVRELYFEEHNLDKGRMENNLEKFTMNFEKCRTFFEISEGKPHTTQKTLF